MPLVRLLENAGFDPEIIDLMSLAFDQACRKLGLSETADDPLREMVARKIIECAQTGVRDQRQLFECALKALQT